MDSVLLVSLFSLVKVITEAYIQYYVLKMWPFQNFTINMASKGQYVNSTHMNMNFCLTRSLVLQKTLAGVRAFVLSQSQKLTLGGAELVVWFFLIQPGLRLTCASLGLLAAERRLREPEKPAREGKSFAPPKFSLNPHEQ